MKKIFALALGCALGLSASEVSAANPVCVCEVAPTDAIYPVYKTNRPAVEERLFYSEAVEREIERVKQLLKDNPYLCWMFENCYPNTIDTTVHYRKDKEDGEDDTFVYTGDIHAMWLRDSGAQVYPYIQLANEDPQLKAMLRGTILRQFKLINIDRYANAFNDGPTGGEWQKDRTDMKMEDHERKYEIDSLCYPIRLAYDYWKKTGDASVFGNVWLSAISNTLLTFKEQQRKNGVGPYSFLRVTDRQGDTVANNGLGNPVKPCGLICSFFRPSDDATTFLYLVPSNFMAVSSLRKAAEILTTINKDASLAQECTDLANEVEAALKKYAIHHHPKYGDIYAYEVDGFGNQLLMDDANVPSLLAMAYLGDVDINDPIYQNTRRFVWSEDNPYFFKGAAGEGIGGPHVGYDMPWPMSIMMKAFTSQDDKEIHDCLVMLQDTDAGKGFIHESFHKDNAGVYTRDWFAWQNTLFGELILKLVNEGKIDLLLNAKRTVKAPAPVAPLPAQHQVDWQKMETYAFIHYGLNTFNDREWGYGDSDPKSFNPKHQNVEQWVRTIKEAGMQGVIMVAKHHDGFTMWPCDLTEYNITKSSYDGPKNSDGKVDIVRELRNACDKYGLKMGLYLSPWDRNYAGYGTRSYIDYYYKQLEQLMTQYGDLFEVWFDGANGGDGYYGGAREKRTIDRRTYYNFPKINEMVAKWQPNAVIFSDGGPGCRWVGNESGYASATNWAFLRSKDVYPGYPEYRTLQYGHADGDAWVASECDTSIRPGWFYHPEEDDKVKTPEQLVDLYYRSVGHNGTLLLNFPVDRNGLINPVDSANAVAFHKIIKRELSKNLLKGLKPKVSSVREGAFGAKNITDGNWDSYWATPDGVTSGSMEFEFKRPTLVNRLMLQEYITLGQRVKSFVVEVKVGNQWQKVDCREETSTIGYKRLLRFQSVKAKALRITITDARGPLCINNVEAFYGGAGSDVVFQAKTEVFKTVPFKIAKQTATDVVLDFGSPRAVNAFHYMPDQSEYNKGLVHEYEIWTCDAEGRPLIKLLNGEFSNIKHNPILQTLHFAPTKTQYLLFRAVKMVKEGEPVDFEKLGAEDI